VATRTDPKVAAAAIVAATATLLVAGCGGGGGTPDKPQPRERQALRAYVGRIEPLRLRVNKLLGGADPILAGYARHTLSAAEAQGGMRRLERRFARYVAQVAAVRPVPPDLTAAQRAYAHTYVQEDAYLRALISALPGRRWGNLPHTEASQRKALVAWRAAIALQAARLDVAIPGDLAMAGRDEVAPSPLGRDG
jgi:hypothetical protein